MASQTVRVRGLADLNRALRRADRDTRLGIRKELRDVAEPVRADAERLAVSNITRIGPKWSRMRVGVTTNLVYVAPRQRGVSARGLAHRKRKNLAGLMMDRAMQPALDRHASEIANRLDRTLDRVANTFN